jgi:tetratricopeptide (TPR) repeat protein
VTAAGSLAGARRWAAVGLALALVVGSAALLGAWATAEEKIGVDTVDASFAARIAVGVRATAVIADHPLFGTGLGSWLQAFRPYQQPPVEGGIWDHAHDDYLELAATSGAAGIALVLLFAIGICRGVRRGAEPAADGSPLRRRRARSEGLESSEWRAALAQPTLLRWGLAGGVTAILVHSLVDFGLQMPANLLLLMVVLGLLVLSAPPQPTGGRWAPVALLALLGMVTVPIVANQAFVLIGVAPLSPSDCLAAADRILSEDADGAQAKALALLDRALDRAPADRDAYEALADALGPGPEGDAALGRALALSPWASELRDRLALRRWARGEKEGAAGDIEESMYRFPYLVSHAYLGDDRELAPHDAADVIRTLMDGDTLTTRLARMDAVMVDAVERGLARALDERASILGDLVSLREARGRWADAAALLRAEAEHAPDGGSYLARAATDYLKAHDVEAAESMLLAALVRTPEQGDLYRALAVDVYAARGDLHTAETVLKAGERNAVDMLPVYDGVTEVLDRREALRVRHMAAPIPSPPPTEDEP